MDIKQLRIAQAPWATKVVVFALFLAQVLVGIACAVLVASSPASEGASLLQAAAYALGLGVPFLALALLLVTARTGIRSIEARTAKFLGEVVPNKLKQLELHEHDPAKTSQPWADGIKSQRLKRAPHGPNLSLSLSPSGNLAHYRLVFTEDRNPLELWLSVEVSMAQATVCLFLPVADLPETRSLRSHCESTLEGAEKSGGFCVDKREPPVETVGGRPHQKLVLRKQLSSDEVLWDPAQVFFFATDLGLMVESFVRECRPLLVVPDQTRAGASAAAQ